MNTPRPTVTPTSAPTAAAVAPTSEATVTSLPPTSTAGPTDTLAPTDAPTTTATETATATRTRIPVIRFTQTPTPTAITFKYAAPQLLEPGAGDSRLAGKDDLVLKWKPVADLKTGECYLVTVRITNVTDPAERYAQSSYLATDTCASTIGGGTLAFTLYIKRHGQPDYEGLLAIASQTTPSNVYQVGWGVNVATIDEVPLSPTSQQFEFTLNSP